MTLFYGTKQLGFPIDHDASRQDYRVREPSGQAPRFDANNALRRMLEQNGTPAAQRALANAPPPGELFPREELRPPQGTLHQVPPGVPLHEAVAARAREWKERKQLVDVFGTRGTMKSHLEKRRAAGGDLPIFELDPSRLTSGTPVTLNGSARQISGRALRGPLVTKPLDGQVPFVVMKDGAMRVGAPLFAPGHGRLNHMDLAGMADQVRYAGTMLFEHGRLTSWNNSSGGYRDHVANAHQ